jgi:CheY-like chemotaxis protein
MVAAEARSPPEGPVLVVDDDPADRLLASTSVARTPGFRVVMAGDGREALEVIGRKLRAEVEAAEGQAA